MNRRVTLLKLISQPIEGDGSSFYNNSARRIRSRWTTNRGAWHFAESKIGEWQTTGGVIKYVYDGEIKIAIAICILQFIHLIFHFTVGQLVINIRATGAQRHGGWQTYGRERWWFSKRLITFCKFARHWGTYKYRSLQFACSAYPPPPGFAE